MSKKETTIEELLTNLQEIVTTQDKALKLAQQIIFLKDRHIELLEKRKDLQLQETNLYKYGFLGLIVFNILLFIILFINVS
jgi:ABC-type sugar transport system ATPase subunit